jgi:hypothetical protein
MAALAVSAVGLGIAVVSWFESRKSRRAAEASAAAADESAEAAQRSARIEADRRHDELAPALRVEWTEVGRRVGVWNSGVRISNERTIDYVEVEGKLLRAPHGAKPAARQIESVATQYVGPESSFPLGELSAAGDTGIVIHPVFEEDGLPRGGPFRLLLKLTAADGASWTYLIDEEVPPPPRIYRHIMRSRGRLSGVARHPGFGRIAAEARPPTAPPQLLLGHAWPPCSLYA